MISTCVESRRSSRCDAVHLQKLSGSTSSNYVEAETSRTFREPSMDGVALQLTGLVGELWDWEAREDMGDKERRQAKEEKRWREGKEEMLVLSSKDACITPEVHVQEGRTWTLSFRVKLTEDRHASILFFFLSDWCDNKNKKSGVCVSVLPSAGCCCQNESIQGSLCGNGKFQHKYHLK